MDLEGAFLDSEGALLHSLPKIGGHGPSSPPVPTSLRVTIKRKINRIHFLSNMGMKTIAISHRFTQLTSGLFTMRKTLFITIIIISKPSSEKQILKFPTSSKDSDRRFRRNFPIPIAFFKEFELVGKFFKRATKKLENAL